MRLTSCIEPYAKEIVHCDIRDANAVCNAVRGCTDVFHVAGCIHMAGSNAQKLYSSGGEWAGISKMSIPVAAVKAAGALISIDDKVADKPPILTKLMLEYPIRRQKQSWGLARAHLKRQCGMP